MTNYDEPKAQHSLTDDQIRTRFRLTEDIARQAVATARDMTERAAQAGPDGVVMVPSAQFQTLVESLGVMHKTLMGSINAQVAAETQQATGATTPPVDSALYLSGGLLKAQNGAAIRQAKLIVDKVRRTATEQGDGPMMVEVPAHALKFISDSVLLTEKLLTPAMLRADSSMESESGYRDRGDLGFMSNWYNTGNIWD